MPKATPYISRLPLALNAWDELCVWKEPNCLSAGSDRCLTVGAQIGSFPYRTLSSWLFPSIGNSWPVLAPRNGTSFRLSDKGCNAVPRLISSWRTAAFHLPHKKRPRYPYSCLRFLSIRYPCPSGFWKPCFADDICDADNCCQSVYDDSCRDGSRTPCGIPCRRLWNGWTVPFPSWKFVPRRKRNGCLPHNHTWRYCVNRHR